MGWFLPAAAAVIAAIGTGYGIYSSERERAEQRRLYKEQKREKEKQAEQLKMEQERLEKIEQEKRDRLRRRGQSMPETMVTSFAGIQPTLGA